MEINFCEHHSEFFPTFNTRVDRFVYLLSDMSVCSRPLGERTYDIGDSPCGNCPHVTIIAIARYVPWLGIKATFVRDWREQSEQLSAELDTACAKYRAATGQWWLLSPRFYIENRKQILDGDYNFKNT